MQQCCKFMMPPCTQRHSHATVHRNEHASKTSENWWLTEQSISSIWLQQPARTRCAVVIVGRQGATFHKLMTVKQTRELSPIAASICETSGALDQTFAVNEWTLTLGNWTGRELLTPGTSSRPRAETESQFVSVNTEECTVAHQHGATGAQPEAPLPSAAAKWRRTSIRAGRAGDTSGCWRFGFSHLLLWIKPKHLFVLRFRGFCCPKGL